MADFSCRCRGNCRCETRLFWRVGESACLGVNCPVQCDTGQCAQCPAHSALLASSKLLIIHPCFKEPIAELTDVLKIGRCDCTVTIPATFADLTDKLKPHCENCGLRFVLTVSIYESEPIEGEPAPATCTQIVEEGEFHIDWALNGVL